MAEVKNAKSNEPEEIKYEEIKDGKFRPLDEPVVENLNRPQQPHAVTDGQPLPEPDFASAAPPKIDLNMGNGGEDEGGSSSNTKSEALNGWPGGQRFQGGSTPRGNSNGGSFSPPPQTPLPDKEKQKAAEATADMLLFIYTNVKSKIPNLIAVSDRKLSKMQKEGLINLNLLIQINPASPVRITVNDFIKQFNDTLFAPFETNPQFIEQIKEPLVRILLKNNAVMSDESIVLFFIIQDAIGTIITTVKSIGQRNDMLDMLKTLTEQSRPAQSVATPTPQQTASQGSTPAYAAEPAKPTTPPSKVHIVASEPEESKRDNSGSQNENSNKGAGGIFPFPPTKKRKPGAGRPKKNKDSIEIIETDKK